MKKIFGLFAALTLVGSGAAWAEGGAGKGGSGMEQEEQLGQEQQTGQEFEGTGGTGQQMGQMGGQEIQGTVLKAERNKLVIDYQGAAVPFEVKKDTQFQGVKGIKEIKEGQQVRASFEVKNKDKNELKSIEVMGAGGTGAEEPQPGMEQPGSEHPGTGGTGEGDVGGGLEEQPEGGGLNY